MGEAKRRRDRERGKTVQWTVDAVQDVLIDPRAAGVGGFPAIVTDDQWIAANTRLLGELGTETYLRTLLAKLHESFDNYAEMGLALENTQG